RRGMRQNRAEYLHGILSSGWAQDFFRRTTVHTPDKAITLGITSGQAWPVENTRHSGLDLFGLQLAHIVRLASLNCRGDALVADLTAKKTHETSQLFGGVFFQPLVTDQKKRQLFLIKQRSDVIAPAPGPWVDQPAAAQPVLAEFLE